MATAASTPPRRRKVMTSWARVTSRTAGTISSPASRPGADLVAEERREGVRFGVAADVAEQRLVVDVAQLAWTQAELLAEPDRQHAGGEGMLDRLAHAEVGRERERRHQLGQADDRRGR